METKITQLQKELLQAIETAKKEKPGFMLKDILDTDKKFYTGSGSFRATAIKAIKETIQNSRRNS